MSIRKKIIHYLYSAVIKTISLRSHAFLSSYVLWTSTHVSQYMDRQTSTPSIFQLFLSSWFSSSSRPSPTTSHHSQDSVPFVGEHYQKPRSATRWIVRFYWKAWNQHGGAGMVVCFCLTWGWPGGFAHWLWVSFSVAQLPCCWDGDPRNTRLTGLLWGCRKEALLLSPWGLAQSKHLTDASLSHWVLAPRLLWGLCCCCCGLASPLIWFLPFGYFLASAQRRHRWELGSRKRRRELPACFPLRAGTGRGQGSTGVADPEPTGAWWWEMFSLSRGRKLLLYWVQSAQWVAGRVCAGHPHSLHPLLLQTLLTPNKPPPVSLPLSFK